MGNVLHLALLVRHDHRGALQLLLFWRRHANRAPDQVPVEFWLRGQAAKDVVLDAPGQIPCDLESHKLPLGHGKHLVELLQAVLLRFFDEQEHQDQRHHIQAGKEPE